MHHHTLHNLLTIAGAACEIVGFTWAIVSASRARTRELDEHGLLGRAWQTLRYWFGEPSQPADLEVYATVSSAATLGVSVRPGGETELQRLSRELGQFRSAFADHQQQVGTRIESLDERIGTVQRTITERIISIEDAQRAVRRRTLRQEIRAPALFILGALLSMAANLVS